MADESQGKPALVLADKTKGHVLIYLAGHIKHSIAHISDFSSYQEILG